MPSCVLCQSMPPEKKHVKLDKLVNSSQTLEEAIRQQISFADQILGAPQSDLGTCTTCFRTINKFYVLLEKVKQFEAFFLEIPAIKTEPEEILIPSEESITKIEEVIKVEPIEREFVEELPILEQVEIKNDFWAENSEKIDKIPVPDDPDFEIRPKKKQQAKKPPKPVRYLRPSDLTPEFLASGQTSLIIDGIEYRIPPASMKFKETKQSKYAKEGDARIRHFLAIKCELCGAEFPGFFRLTQHFRQVHPETEVYLKCCGTKFHRRNQMLDHLERHDPSISNKCPTCQKTYLNGKTLQMHIKNQHSDLEKPKFVCNICGKIFNSTTSLRSHLISHDVDPERQFECYICKRTGFQNSHKVKLHLYNFHRFGQPKRVTCHICSKEVKSYYLKEHIKVKHSNQKAERIQCENCNFWIQKQSMASHKKHHQQSSATCEKCGKTFTAALGLKRHNAIFHEDSTNAKVFTCEYCGKIFRSKTRLREHTAAMHTRELLYKCRVPGCEFQNRHHSGIIAHHKRMHYDYWKQHLAPESRRGPAGSDGHENAESV